MADQDLLAKLGYRPPIKVIVNLPDETVQQILELAKLRRCTATQVIRQAIATEAFLDREIRQLGKKLLIAERRWSWWDLGYKTYYREVIFSP